MRKMLAVAVILGLAALPAMAAVGIAEPVSAASLQYNTYNSQNGQITPGSPGSRFSGPIYQDFLTIGSFLPQGTTATYPLPIADDLHAVGSGTMTSFTFGYFMPSATAGGIPQGLGAVTFNFHTNTAADGPVPPFPTTPGFFSITLTGLPTGANAFAVTGLAVPVGTDFWIEQDWAGNGTGRAGPLIVAGSTLGYSHSSFAQTGSLWTLGTTWADFYHGVNVVPEPATIGLLAFGGLAILRRRR